MRVATTSSEGGAMDELEDRAFAAFDVNPAESRELMSVALGPSVGARILHFSCWEEASCCISACSSPGSMASISLTRCHTFALKRLLFVLDLPGPCMIERAAGKALRKSAVASEAFE